MKYNFYTFTVLGVLLLPQPASAQSLQELFTNTINFIGEVVIPFLLGIAFLIFVINVIRFFVIGADNTDSKDNAKNLAIYSVAAFVFIIIFWGLINLLTSSIGLGPENCIQPTSDYYTGPTPPDCYY